MEMIKVGQVPETQLMELEKKFQQKPTQMAEPIRSKFWRILQPMIKKENNNNGN